MESYVRGKTVDAIKDANTKVNRALRAGAMAVGAEVEIDDHPGYMPYTRNENLEKILIKSVTDLYGESEIKHREHSTGSTDMGDFSCIMPTTSIGMIGTEGAGHSRHLKIIDPVKQYIVPAKAIAVTVIDLLFEDAEPAKSVINSFQPTIKREEYTGFMKKLVE